MATQTGLESKTRNRVKEPRQYKVVMYNDDFTLNESYMVRNDDTIAIKEGYHPVAAAPGYSIYYLWVMAGKSGRKLTPCDDPKHAWVKAVEEMVKNS